MPILHLDTDSARQTARQLMLFNNQLLAEGHRLRLRLTLLQMSWSGGSSKQFQEEMAILLNRLNYLADEASHLNRRLQRKVDEWEEVDRYF